MNLSTVLVVASIIGIAVEGSLWGIMFGIAYVFTIVMGTAAINDILYIFGLTKGTSTLQRWNRVHRS